MSDTLVLQTVSAAAPPGGSESGPTPPPLWRSIMQYASEAITLAKASDLTSCPMFMQSCGPSPAQLCSLSAAVKILAPPMGQREAGGAAAKGLARPMERKGGQGPEQAYQHSELLADALELIALCQVSFCFLFMVQNL